MAPSKNSVISIPSSADDNGNNSDVAADNDVEEECDEEMATEFVDLSVGSAASRSKIGAIGGGGGDGNLALLQEYLRRDPESYREEFGEHFRHFQQSMRLLELQPRAPNRMGVEPLAELVNFLASVAHGFPGNC